MLENFAFDIAMGILVIFIIAMLLLSEHSNEKTRNRNHVLFKPKNIKKSRKISLNRSEL